MKRYAIRYGKKVNLSMIWTLREDVEKYLSLMVENNPNHSFSIVEV